MKIAVITSRFPYPLEKGDKLRIYHQIRLLSRRNEVILICLTDQSITENEKRELAVFCSQVFIFKRSKIQIAFNILTGFLRGLPISVSYFYSRSVKSRIEEVLLDLQPEVIYCHLIRTSEYVKNIPVRKILDFMDCFSIGMLRRSEHAGLLKKMIWKMEYERIRRYEKTIFYSFDRHVIISEQDRGYLPLLDKSRISVIRNGIDTEGFRNSAEMKKEYEIVFVGNMGYYPNISAAKYLVNRILPLVSLKIPEARLLLAGARPSPQIRKLEGKKVTVSGWMDQIRDAYHKGQIFVAPMFESIGLQNKILEAMASGIPCLTTHLVNNSVRAKVGEEILVGQNPRDFADQILELLSNEELYTKIVKNAYKFVREKYSWASSVDALEQLMAAEEPVTQMENVG